MSNRRLSDYLKSDAVSMGGFDTIIHYGSDGSVTSYHGKVLSKGVNSFEFSLRVNGLLEIWQCFYDYWTLI